MVAVKPIKRIADEQVMRLEATSDAETPLDLTPMRGTRQAPSASTQSIAAHAESASMIPSQPGAPPMHGSVAASHGGESEGTPFEFATRLDPGKRHLLRDRISEVVSASPKIKDLQRDVQAAGPCSTVRAS